MTIEPVTGAIATSVISSLGNYATVTRSDVSTSDATSHITQEASTVTTGAGLLIDPTTSDTSSINTPSKTTTDTPESSSEASMTSTGSNTVPTADIQSQTSNPASTSEDYQQTDIPFDEQTSLKSNTATIGQTSDPKITDHSSNETLKDQASTTTIKPLDSKTPTKSVTTSEDQPPTTLITTVKNQTTTSSVPALNNHPSATSITTTNEQTSTTSNTTLEDQSFTTSVTTPEDQQSTTKVTTPEDKPSTTSVTTPEDQPSTTSVTTPEDQQSTTSVTTLEDKPSTTSVTTLEDQPSTTSVTNLEDQQSTTSVITPEDQPFSTSVTTPEDKLSTTSVTTLEDKQSTTSLTTPEDKPSTTSVTTPQDKPSTTSVTTPEDLPSTTSVTTLEDQQSTTSVISPEDQPSITSVTTLEENPSTTSVTTPEDKPSTTSVTTPKHRPSTTSVTTSDDQQSTTSITTLEDKASATSPTSLGDQSTTTLVTTVEDLSSTKSVTTLKDQPSTTSITTFEDKPSTSSVTISEDQTSSTSVTTPEDKPFTTSVTTPEDQPSTTSVTTPEDKQSTTSVTTPEDKPSTTSVTTLEDKTSATSATSLGSQLTTTSVTTFENQPLNLSITALKDQPSTTSITISEEKPSTTSVITLKDQPSTASVATLEDKSSTTSFTTPADQSSTNSVTTPEDPTSTTSVTTPEDQQSTTEVTTLEDQTSTASVTTLEDQPSTTSVTAFEDQPSTTPVTTLEDPTSTTSVTTLEDQPSITSVTTLEDQLSTTSVTTLDDQPSTTSVTTLEDKPSTISVTTLEDQTFNTSMTTLEDQLSTSSVTTPQDQTSTRSNTTLEDQPVTTSVTTPEDKPSATSVTTPEDQQSTTSVTTPEDQPSTTSVTTHVDKPSTTPVTTFENQTSTTSVTTLKDQPSTTSVTTPEDKPSTTSVTTPEDQPSTTSVTTLEDQPSTTSVTTLEDQTPTTSVTTHVDKPSTTPVTTFENQTSTTSVTTLKDQPSTTSVTTPEDKPSTTSVTTPEDQPSTTSVTTLEDQQSFTSVTTLEDQQSSTSGTTLEDQQSTTSVTTLEDQQSTTSVTTLEDQQSTTSFATLEDQQSTTSVTTLEDQPSTTSVTTLEDQPSTTSVTTLEDQTSTASVTTLEDKPSTTSVTTLEDQLSTTSVTTLEDQQSTTSVTTVEDQLSTTSVTTLEDQPSTTSVTTPKDQPSTTSVTTPEEKPSTTSVTTIEDQQSTTSVTTLKDQTSTTSVTTSEDQPSTTSVTTPEEKPSTTSVTTPEDQTSTTSVTTLEDQQSTTSVTTPLDKPSTTSVTTLEDQTSTTSVTTLNNKQSTTSFTTLEDQKMITANKTMIDQHSSSAFLYETSTATVADDISTSSDVTSSVSSTTHPGRLAETPSTIETTTKSSSEPATKVTTKNDQPETTTRPTDSASKMVEPVATSRSPSATEQPTPTVAAPSQVDDSQTVFIAEMSVVAEWDPAYDDPTSEEYRDLQHAIIAFILQLFREAHIADLFSITIVTFSPGSINVEYEVVMSHKQYEGDSLREAIKKAYGDIVYPSMMLKEDVISFVDETKPNEVIEPDPQDPSPTQKVTVDLCATKPCNGNAVCQMVDGTAICRCQMGYFYNRTGCTDVDECLASSSCPSHSDCINNEGSFSCQCKPGFVVTTDGCEDIDECLTAPCGDHSNCYNSPGTFQCVCHSGYQMVNNACVDRNECLSFPCPGHAHCNNTDGSYMCTCYDGFVSVDDKCLDINECEDDPAKCPVNSDCVNIDGGHLCVCRNGFNMVNGTCEDLDECKIQATCHSNSKCSNTVGSYKCVCEDGFQDKITHCEDINECLSGLCGDIADCLNTKGSYQCSCKTGYTIINNACGDIDECLYHVCSSNANCTNVPGSYTCKCHTGYIDIGTECEDINECNTHPSPCPVNSDCDNTVGSYTCTCDTGYSMVDGGYCRDIDECLWSPCVEYSSCDNSVGSYSCLCLPGFIKEGNRCVDIDECKSSPCQGHSKCQNNHGNYTCICEKGFFQSTPYTCIDARVFNATIKVLRVNGSDAVYSDDLTDEKSEMHKFVTDSFKSSVLQVFSSSGFESGYFGTEIERYAPGSIIIISTVYLHIDSTTKEDDIVDSLVAGIPVLRSEGLEVLPSDIAVAAIDECENEEWNSCSQNSVCTLSSGVYVCTCDTGYMDIGVDSGQPQGSTCAVIDESNQDPIIDFVVTTEHHFYRVGETVTFTLQLTRGSHVKYTAVYGDGVIDIFNDPEELAFISPVSLTHRYSSAGNYTVDISARNTPSNKTISHHVFIQDGLSNLFLTCKERNLSYPGDIDFVITSKSLISFADIHMRFMFGDGESLYEYVGDAKYNSSFTFSHTFNPGVYQTTLNISNMVSFLIIKKTFVIEEPISGLSVSSSKYVLARGTEIVISLRTLTGSNVTFYVDFGKNDTTSLSLNNIRRGPSSVHLPFTYTDVGTYNITVIAHNTNSSKKEVSDLIFVQNPVRDVVLKVSNPLILSPPGDVYAELSYIGDKDPPSHVVCTILLNNTYSSRVYIELMDNSNPSYLNSSWDTAESVGDVEMFVNCSNKLNAALMINWINIQRKIEGLSINVNKLYIPVNGQIDFDFLIGVASHAKYEISFKDGHVVSGALGQDIFYNRQISLTHTFQHKGIYVVTFIVRNAVWTASVDIDIWVLTEVKGLAFVRYYVMSDKFDLSNYGHGDKSNIFPLERDLVLNASVSSGNHLTFSWNFGDGVSLATYDEVMRRKFISPGTYNVTLNASNPLFSASESAVITFQHIVLMQHITNDGPSDAFETITFELELARPGTNSCFVWYMGDGSQETVYGESECEDIARINKYFYVKWSPTGVLHHSHMYRTNGTFTVNVTGFNEVSTQTVTDLAIITGISCFYPKVNIEGGRQQIDLPVHHHKSKRIILQSTAEIDCNSSKEVSYEWNIYRIEEGKTYLDYIFQEYPIHLVATDHFRILLPPSTFLAGQYKIVLNVSMFEIHGLSSVHFTYLNITDTPLSLSFVGGIMRSVGFNTDFIIDALSDTYDPDLLDATNKTGLTFTWRCRLFHETFPSDNLPYVDIPTTEQRQNMTWGQGCFGTGIGNLNLTTGVLTLNSFLLQPRSENVFEVVVQKGDRSSTAQQTLVVINGRPKQLNIKCEINCNSKMNPSGEFLLLGRCRDCSQFDKIQFKWSLFLQNLTTLNFEEVVELKEFAEGDIISSVLVLKPATLTGGRVYRLKLEAQVHGYVDSFTVYEFVTNLPPYGGMCNVVPEQGFALETSFTIACHGWKNHGEDQDNLLYTFWLRPVDTNHLQLLYYGTHPYTPDSQFPLGPSKHDYIIDIIVRIQNPIGEYVEYRLEVQVMNPTKEKQVDSLIGLASGDNNEISSLLSSGKSQEAKQLIVAMASLINDSPLNFAGVDQSVVENPTTTQQPNQTNNDTIQVDTTTLETTSTTSSGTAASKFSTVVTTTIDPVSAEEERLKKEQEEKEKRIQFREVLATTLEQQTNSLTINSLQQTAMCFAVVTQETTELSDNTQDSVVNSMLKMANSLDEFVDNSKSESMDQEWNTAIDMLSSLGSVAKAAVDMSLDGSSYVTETRQTQSPTQPAGSNNINTTQAHSPTTPTTRSTTLSDREMRRQKVKEITTKVLQVAEILYQAAIKTRFPGGPALRLEAEHLSMVAERREVSKLLKAVLNVTSGAFAMPSSDQIISSSANTSYIDSKVISASQNTYVWDDSSSKIKSPVLSLSLYDSDKNEIPIADLEEDITIDITIPSEFSNNVRKSSVSNLDEKLLQFVIDAGTNDTSIHIIIRPEGYIPLEVYVRYNLPPTVDTYDDKFSIPRLDEVPDGVEDADMADELAHTVFISPEFVKEHGIGAYVIGIKSFENETEEVETYDEYYADYIGPTVKDEIRVNFTITYRTSGCLFWNITEEKWMSNGCRVSPLSNSKFTRCLCDHLTSFGADFYTPPNQINFNTVFDNLGAKIADNWAVLATLIVIFVLFFILAVWARHKDKLDIVKWGVAPLADNVVSDPYYYQIAVFTGMRRGGGTKSKISFVLAGDNEDTGVRHLTDEKGIKVCSRGSVNNYVMSSQQWLGPLTYLRIWHDNKGKGKHQGWYLSKVVVSDLQTGQTYFFMCNRWLAVEEDDGMIDRMLPVAGTEDLTKFNTLFLTKTKRSLTDSHLWVSVFSRPQRSHFTRVQRLSCILSLVMTTMVANAMFYRTEDNVENKESFVIGPIEFSLSGLYISFISSLVVLPVNLIIDNIFRKTRPRQNKVTNSFVSNIQPLRTLSQVDLRPCKVDDDTKISDVTDDDFNVQKKHLKSESANTIGGISTASDKALISRGSVSRPATANPKQPKTKFSLPPPCIYIAWILVFLSSVISAFITFLYSMEWGKEKSLAWLSAMLLSIGESITVIQPTKIITIAVIISALLKKPDVEEVMDNDDTPMAPKPDEELLFTKPTKALRPQVKVDAPDPEKLAEARKNRLNEIQMHQIIREIIFYFIFLALILLVASHSRDPKAYNVKTAILNMVNPKNALIKVKTVADFWSWLEKTLLPNMYLTHKWNGDPADSEEQRLISTRTAYRVGPIRIRQQRVKKEGCKVSKYMRHIITSCAVDWGIDDADDQEYQESWNPLNVNQSFDHIVNYPWKYRPFLNTGGLPYAGDLGVYPGGGYIADFIGKRERAFQFLGDLRQKNWIDRYTRAVFLMFTVYNANVNMFSTVNIVFELPSTGEFMVKENIKAFRLFSYLGGYGIFVIFCEVSAAISVIYFFIRECKKIRKEKKNYFKSFWNVLELLTMLTALGCIVMYIIRHFITAVAVSSVTKLRDKFYNFEKVAMWDEVFGYVMAFTIFASIIKLIHMFRFNRKMSMIAGTLKNSTSDISAFSVVFVVFLTGFATWGYIMFGRNMESYKSMIQSIETLLAFSLGEYDYLALVSANRIFGPLFFFSFFLFINFILLNVFVTILNESITAVRNDVSKQSNEFEIVNFAWTRFKSWIGIDFDRILLDVQRKYMIGKCDEAPPTIDDSMKNIASKLDTIISRLEKLDRSDGEKIEGRLQQNSPQITIRSDTPLFTRLFPTLGRQKINLE